MSTSPAGTSLCSSRRHARTSSRGKRPTSSGSSASWPRAACWRRRDSRLCPECSPNGGTRPFIPIPSLRSPDFPAPTPSTPAHLFDQLGHSIAQWHEMTPPELPGSRPPAHHDRTDNLWLRRALDPATTRQAVAEAADRLACSDRVEQWGEQFELASELHHVLVHGDLHEDQLLVVDGQLTGILDWETARIDHPFWDFDLSEWGTGLWRDHRIEFTKLSSRAWRPYASERGLDPDPAPLETAFRLRHALFLMDNDRDPSLAGPSKSTSRRFEGHLGALSLNV